MLKMKRTLVAVLSALLVMSCNNTENGYIGPKVPQAPDGTMTPEALHEISYLSNPQLSPDGSLILYTISCTSIEKNSSCSNLWLCNADGSNVRQLTRYAKSVAAAKWSNDGSSIYFLQGGQLFKAAFKAGKLGKKVCLSDIPEGIQDFSISPDGNQIYFVSTIPGPVKSPKDSNPDLDKAEAYVAEGLMYRHWDHWVTETPRTFVAALNDNKITHDNSFDILGSGDPGYELPTEPFGGAEQLCWAPDSRHIAYSCRKKVGKEYAFSTNCEIYIYDVLTGAETQVTDGGGYDTDPVWSPDGSRLAWISMERDGYEADKQRLFVADVRFGEQPQDGQSSEVAVSNIREVAGSLDADVSGIVWSNCGRKIFFPATVDGIQGLFCCVVDSKEVTRLTPEDWWYNFSAPFGFQCNENEVVLLSTFQSNCRNNEMAAITIPKDGSATTMKAISGVNDEYFASIGEVRQESILLDSPDGGKLQCWVLYPPQFDPQKKYPAIEMFNGGPQSCLDQSWSKRWNFFLMAQKGYVVILPNRHGNSGFGQAWKEQISGDYQGLNMQDYMIAGRWIKEQPWCGKLAGVGASYGGFSVYNMMGIHGDLYDCFISHAGIFDERIMWYTTEEAWFGNWDAGGLKEYAYEPGKTGPQGDGITFGGIQQAGAPYASTPKAQYHYANDPQEKVTKWHTPILCIHGMLDFRIPYTQGMAAFNAAQMMGVPSKLVIFPQECHWIQTPQNCIFWQREFFSWLEQWIVE